MCLISLGIGFTRVRLTTKSSFNSSKRLLRAKFGNTHICSFATAYPIHNPDPLEDGSNAHSSDQSPRNTFSDIPPIRQTPLTTFENVVKVPNQVPPKNPHGPHNDVTEATEATERIHLIPRSTSSHFEDSPAERDLIAQAITRVSDTLRREDSYGLLVAISQASADKFYIGSLPTTTFIEICRLLDPGVFIGPYSTIYEDIYPLYQENMREKSLQMDAVFTDYTETFRKIIQQRIDCQKQVTIQEYRSLLNIASSIRDGGMASKIIESMFSSDMKLDTVCYNHCFDAICWSGSHEFYKRKRRRVLTYDLERRKGVKSQIANYFSRMVGTGVKPDTKTFGLLMTALGREGDIPGVKSILEKVWDVNVDNIMSCDDDVFKAAGINVDSPLYPTQDLLFVVAHIFGSNNDIPTALRVVDYISRRYTIQISTRVWGELLEWTFILSCPLFKNSWADRWSGHLPLGSVRNLWTTMISPPYNCNPSIRMHSYYIKNFHELGALDYMLEAMVAGLSLFQTSLQKYFSLRKLHLKAEENDRIALSQDDLSRSSVKLQHMTRLAKLQYRRDFMLVQRWFRWLLSGRRWYNGSNRVILWERLKLPLAVEIFWYFRPNGLVIYRMATGWVELSFIGQDPTRRFQFDHNLPRKRTRNLAKELMIE